MKDEGSRKAPADSSFILHPSSFSSAVLEAIEQELVAWRQRVETPAADGLQDTPPPAADGPGDGCLGAIEAALARAGHSSSQTETILAEVAADLARWRDRAAELERRLLESATRPL